MRSERGLKPQRAEEIGIERNGMEWQRTAEVETGAEIKGAWERKMKGKQGGEPAVMFNVRLNTCMLGPIQLSRVV